MNIRSSLTMAISTMMTTMTTMTIAEDAVHSGVTALDLPFAV